MSNARNRRHREGFKTKESDFIVLRQRLFESASIVTQRVTSQHWQRLL
jgi:hypothetical protein